jgi:ribonuclease HI
MAQIIAYTDGSCYPNPGPGGWGLCITQGEAEVLSEACGGEPETTNNRMEMMGIVKALEWYIENDHPKLPPLKIVTDSQYAMNGLTQWYDGWKARGWKTAAGKGVKNVDIWLRLKPLYDRVRPELEWVRGHTGVFGNERADDLALQGRLEVDDVN